VPEKPGTRQSQKSMVAAGLPTVREVGGANSGASKPENCLSVFLSFCLLVCLSVRWPPCNDHQRPIGTAFLLGSYPCQRYCMKPGTF